MLSCLNGWWWCGLVMENLLWSLQHPLIYVLDHWLCLHPENEKKIRFQVKVKQKTLFTLLTLFVDELVLGGGGGGAPLADVRGGQGGGSQEG